MPAQTGQRAQMQWHAAGVPGEGRALSTPPGAPVHLSPFPWVTLHLEGTYVIVSAP